MRTFPFALALMAVSLGAGAAEVAEFHGQVVRDGSVLTDVSLSVPEGPGTSLKLSDGTALEFSVGGTAKDGHSSLVRLVDSSGRVLHSATTPGINSAKTFRYVICGARVTFQSPLAVAHTAPSCPASGV